MITTKNDTPVYNALYRNFRKSVTSQQAKAFVERFAITPPEFTPIQSATPVSVEIDPFTPIPLSKQLLSEARRLLEARTPASEGGCTCEDCQRARGEQRIPEKIPYVKVEPTEAQKEEYEKALALVSHLNPEEERVEDLPTIKDVLAGLRIKAENTRIDGQDYVL